MATNNIKVGIIGGTGYTGVELLRILANHADAEVMLDNLPILCAARIHKVMTLINGGIIKPAYGAYI